MGRVLVLFIFLLLPFFSVAQKSIRVSQFTKEQKQEWDMFYENWSSNGNGTCTPMMDRQIDSAKCTGFKFTANLTIGSNGLVKKVKIIKSSVHCNLKQIEKELLDCFIDTLKMDMNMYLFTLKGKTILNVDL